MGQKNEAARDVPPGIPLLRDIPPLLIDLVLRTARDGEVIGEASFLTGLPRYSTVTVREQSNLPELDHNALAPGAREHRPLADAQSRLYEERALTSALARSRRPPLIAAAGPTEDELGTSTAKGDEGGSGGWAPAARQPPRRRDPVQALLRAAGASPDTARWKRRRKRSARMRKLGRTPCSPRWRAGLPFRLPSPDLRRATTGFLCESGRRHLVPVADDALRTLEALLSQA